MQPNDDFRRSDVQDAQLSDVLKEWQVPETPHSLDARVLRIAREPWWRFLINGYIRVPVPVACCMAVVMLFAAWRSVKAPEAGTPCSIAARPSVCTSAVPGTC